MKSLFATIVFIFTLTGCLLFLPKGLKIGSKYKDFSAKSINGNTIQLSDSIKSKIAVIYLWSSWCTGSLGTSKILTPLYEKYKGKSFTIIGIANEPTDTVISTIKKHNFPWITLVDLNKESEVWKLYNIGEAGGVTYLIDQEGTILSYNVKEFDKIIQEKLK